MKGRRPLSGTEEDWKQWDKAARREGKAWSQWAREKLRAAARKDSK